MLFDNLKTEPQILENEFVPEPPPGSPPASLPQPILKCPEKFIVNQLIYFHYNINNHSMYVSPCPYPTHDQPPPQPNPSPASQPSQQPPVNPNRPNLKNCLTTQQPVMPYPSPNQNAGYMENKDFHPAHPVTIYRMRQPQTGLVHPEQYPSAPPTVQQQLYSPQSHFNRFPSEAQAVASSPINKASLVTLH